MRTRRLEAVPVPIHAEEPAAPLPPAGVTAPPILATPARTRRDARVRALLAFRQGRESTGRSQRDVSRALDVSESLVKAWEDPEGDHCLPLALLFDARLPLGVRAILLAAVEAEHGPEAAVPVSTEAECATALVMLGQLVAGIGADLADGRVTAQEASARTADVLRAQRALDRALRAQRALDRALRALVACAGGARG